ncbi:MAG: ABC transporter transmembrane domain-containing protein [Anaerolineales bacterium]|nr:ABC transporter transmembrane domain-containing protein [Anaerolineales bacterium]
MLVTILLSTGLSLLTPLIFRNMIDVAIPARDARRLVWLGIALLVIPAATGAVNVIQRRLNSVVGEGVIYDLRSSLFARLQRMSLRFFTNTKVGELMSRLNNDVIGAQNAISNTIVNIATNLIQTVALLAVMLTLEWRLTLLSVVILPLFAVAAQRLGSVLRDIARQAMNLNAQMNAHMNETLNIGGALLVKLFGRAREEEKRFRERAGNVRDIGIRRAVVGSTFFVVFGLVSAVGTALVYGLGGYYVIAEIFTVGAIVAFGSYLGQLYGALQGLAGAPVEFSTSMVSFERVFEILDLPLDIVEKENASELRDVKGELQFEDVSFNYSVDESKLLKDVKRYGRMDDVGAVLSLTERPKTEDGGRKPADGQGGRVPPDGEADATSQARDVALSGISFAASPDSWSPSSAPRTRAKPR